MFTVGLQGRVGLELVAPLFKAHPDAERFCRLCMGKYVIPTIDEAPLFFVHPQASEMLSQCKDVVDLADKSDLENLRLVLLLTLAEATSKLFFKYRGHGDSRRYCMRFFSCLCLPQCRKGLMRLAGGAAEMNVAELLCAERCDAIHRGRLAFWHSLGPPRWTRTEHPYPRVRHVVLTGCINGIQMALAHDCKSNECIGHPNVLEQLICNEHECGFVTHTESAR